MVNHHYFVDALGAGPLRLKACMGPKPKNFTSRFTAGETIRLGMGTLKVLKVLPPCMREGELVPLSYILRVISSHYMDGLGNTFSWNETLARWESCLVKQLQSEEPIDGGTMAITKAPWWGNSYYRSGITHDGKMRQ